MGFNTTILGALENSILSNLKKSNFQILNQKAKNDAFKHFLEDFDQKVFFGGLLGGGKFESPKCGSFRPA